MKLVLNLLNTVVLILAFIIIEILSVGRVLGTALLNKMASLNRDCDEKKVHKPTRTWHGSLKVNSKLGLNFDSEDDAKN